MRGPCLCGRMPNIESTVPYCQMPISLPYCMVDRTSYPGSSQQNGGARSNTAFTGLCGNGGGGGNGGDVVVVVMLWW